MKLPARSIQGVGLNRQEYDVYREMSDPTGFIDQVVKTEEYAGLSEDEKELSLQLIVDDFQDKAEQSILSTDNEFFRGFRQRMRAQH